MRTARFCGCPLDVSSEGGSRSRGVSVQGSLLGGRSPPPPAQNDSHVQNTTLPQTSFAGGKKVGFTKKGLLQFRVLNEFLVPLQVRTDKVFMNESLVLGKREQKRKRSKNKRQV